MRILVVGDLHLRYELPYGSAVSDGRRAEWGNVKNKIIETAKDCDAVAFLGDLFNSKHNHSSVIREAVEFFKSFGDKEIHVLVGNHERYSKFTALDFLQRLDHKNWHIYTEPCMTTVAGVDTMMIPFMTPALLGVETKEEGVDTLIGGFPDKITPLAFIHHAVTGSKVYGDKMDLAVDFFNEIILPKNELEARFEHVFGGHIHEKQRLSPQTIITGSVFTHAVGEHNKSIWIYEDGRVEEIPLPVRSIYKLNWEEMGSKEELPSNSIVKCYVTSRETNLDDVKKFLDSFDASLLVEQYPSEREKVHFEEGSLDFSVEGLLKLYAEAKGFSHAELLELLYRIFHPRHKIGKHGAVGFDTPDGRVCAECNKPIK